MTLPLDIRHLKNKVYYSQNREDLILEAFFPDLEKGFYVDIGGYDPDYDSVTKLFYDRGWNGITVEPQPKNFLKFEKARKRDININCGVSDRSGELTLRSYKNGGLSTFSMEMIHDYDGRNDDVDTSRYEDILVPVKTLSSIFKENNVSKVHFMKVDVEGMEYEVLAGNDWVNYRPIVLCIEANHIVKDWHDLLRSVKYEMVYSDGLNEYYRDTNVKDVPFNYVDHVVTRRGGGLAYADYRDIKNAIARLDKENKAQHYNAHVLTKQNEALVDHIRILENNLKSRKVLARRLVRASLDKIRNSQK